MSNERISEQLEESVFLKKIFRKKNPDQLVNDTKKSNLKKSLGATDLIVLGVGAIIGSGIFTVSGVAINGEAQAGPSFILSVLIIGVACIFSALCYAEFAAMMPVAGSAYTYTFAALGELPAWLIGWALMLEYAIGNIAVACGWTGYLFEFLKGFQGILPDWLIYPPVWLICDYHTAVEKCVAQGLNPQETIPMIFGVIPFSLNLPAILIVMFMTWLLYMGMKESAKLAGLIVAVKLIVIFLFIGVGAFYITPENWTPFMPSGFHGVFKGAFLMFFAYIGFDALSTVAEETKNPQKNLPIGIIASLIICTIVYALIAAVLTGMIPWNTVDTHAPIAAAMRSVNQDWIAGFISLGAVAGLTSVLLVLQMGGSRILFAMSRDNLIPSVFSKVHPKHKTPHKITIAVGAFIILGTLFFNLEQAAHLCNIGTFAAFIMVSVGVLILRKTDPDRKRAFKVPFYPYIPILSIIICVIIIALGIPLNTFLFFIGWLVLGGIIYMSYGFKNGGKDDEEYIPEEQQEEISVG